MCTACARRVHVHHVHVHVHVHVCNTNTPPLLRQATVTAVGAVKTLRLTAEKVAPSLQPYVAGLQP